ncbi:MAG: hypothetical protein JO071_00900 [Deltaproteobacteria bacterium]|nr:hypothetical protein [Deltaproteobacteria bacterium]
MIPAKQTETSISQLRELGFDPSAPPADAVAKLASLRTGANQIAIARVLGQIAAPEAAAMLAEMEVGTSGRLRREIRRSLFRLRQHGIETPVIAQPGKDAVQPADSITGLSGMMSVGDSDGMRIVWMIKARAGGGLKRLWALVSEKDGLLAVAAESLSRKELRADRAELEQRAGAPMVEADWRLADFIMCEAYRRTAEERRARVGNFLSLRAEIVPAAPPASLRHPIYDEFAAEAAGDPPADLMQEPDIAAYKLPQDAIKPFADEMAQLEQSTLVLNRMVQEERVNAVLERAIEQLLTGDLAHRLRRRLEDTAYYFARAGKRAQAAWAVTAAAKLRDQMELKRIAFFQFFMRAQLGAILAEQQEKQQEQPRLIMTPAEMMRARAAAQARMAQRGRLR